MSGQRMAAALAAVLVAAAPSAVLGQNVRDLTPPGGAVQELPPLPPPNAAVEAQARGEFPTMDGDIGPSGLIQDAWTTARPESGIYRPKWSPARVVKVHLREFITTTIALPAGEEIGEWVIGDETHFGTRPARLPNQQHVWVKKPGADSNLNIISTSGTIYSFYLRGETWNSRNIGYQVVEIDPVVPGFSTPAPQRGSIGQGPEPRFSDASGPYVEASLKTGVSAGGDSGEWLHENPYDPAKIRLDRIMRGDPEIAPQAVFRDDRFTYLDFNNVAGQPWPAAWAVYDRVDQPVNTRKSQDGRFLIVETIQPITLRHGQKVVCILPVGAEGRGNGKTERSGSTLASPGPGPGYGL